MTLQLFRGKKNIAKLLHVKRHEPNGPNHERGGAGERTKTALERRKRAGRNNGQSRDGGQELRSNTRESFAVFNVERQRGAICSENYTERTFLVVIAMLEYPTKSLDDFTTQLCANAPEHMVNPVSN
uniref:Uncharacterized protein n=1 Tax=Vespula pensylvanica TaxID=30213 RepID=A0A834UFF7_VESPE|nr:hypothetical protein H0235_003783 [Vespula pensylvanica]